MGSDRHDFEKLVQELSEKYDIMDTKFKPYSLCTWGHTSVDATKKVFEENDIYAKDVESVRVKSLKRAVDFLVSPAMETICNAKFSLPHEVSMFALRKKPGLEWMSKENMFHNPEAKAVAEKVTLEVGTSAEQIPFEENGLAIPFTAVIKRRMKLPPYCEILLTQQFPGNTVRNCSTTTTTSEAGISKRGFLRKKPLWNLICRMFSEIYKTGVLLNRTGEVYHMLWL